MNRLRWIDGLRGIASFIVAFDHYFSGEIKAPFRSFWDDPPEDNRLVIQLFPIRFIFAGIAMVPLFMVLAGYVISIKYIKLRDVDGLEIPCFRFLQAATIRKFFRLYLPIVPLAVLAQLVYFCDLFHWPFGDDVLRGAKPWTSPGKHIICLVQYLVDLMNIIQFQWTRGFNGQFWTIPFEFRGSCIVHLLIFTFSSWKTNIRLLSLILVLMYLLWYGYWDIFSFVGGVYLAELRAASYQQQEKWREPKRTNRGMANIETRRSTSILRLIFFLGGFYLLCLKGENEELPPGYRGLSAFQSRHWTRWNEYVDVQYCWHGVGAMMVVFSISHSPQLQRPLESRLPQYLGRISFSLYLVHELVYRIWRNPLIDAIWWKLQGQGYPGTPNVKDSETGTFLAVWIGSGVILGMVTIFSAELCRSTVERGCSSLAKYLESFATVQHREKRM